MIDNLLESSTSMAKYICDNYVNENSIVIDATCGNGNDTLYFAKKCKRVYGFDIQSEALVNTSKLLDKEGVDNVTLICDSFVNMAEYIKEESDLIIFNLGYLPGGDKNVTTKSDETLKALDCSLNLLKCGGVLCVVVYWGHPEGKKEKEAVMQFCSNLDNHKFHSVLISKTNQENCPPQIVLIHKK